MNLRRAFCHYAVLTGLLLIPASCSKSDRAKIKELPIMGKPSDPAIELKAKWKPGSRYVIRMELTRENEVRRANRPQPDHQQERLAHEVAVTVTNAAANEKLGVDLELLALAVNLSVGERDLVNYDSQSEVVGAMGSPIAESLEKLVGGHIYCLLSPNNKVLKAEGIKEFMARAESTGASSGTGPDPRRGTAASRRFFSPDFFKPILDLTGMPDRPVRVGDSWSVQREAGSGPSGPLLANATYTFKGWQEHEQRKCVRIDITGTLVPKMGNASAPIGNSKVTGQCWFDPALGFSIETVFDQMYTITNVVAQPRPGTNGPPPKVSSPARQTLSIKLTEFTTL